MRRAIYIFGFVFLFGVPSSQAEEEAKTYEGFLILAPEVDTFRKFEALLISLRPPATEAG